MVGDYKGILGVVWQHIALVAQRIAYQTSNLGVAGSNPVECAELYFYFIQTKVYFIQTKIYFIQTLFYTKFILYKRELHFNNRSARTHYLTKVLFDLLFNGALAGYKNRVIAFSQSTVIFSKRRKISSI